MNKHKETTDRTRQNLLDAFWAFYTTRRIDQITVKEIVNRAGYNRSTFYEYFRDVYEVLEYIETQSLIGLQDLPPLIFDREALPAIVQTVINLHQDRFQYFGVLLGAKGDPSFQRKLKENLKASLLDRLSIRQEKERLKIDLMLEYILSGLIGVLIYAFEKRPDLSTEQLIELVYSFFQEDLLRDLQQQMKLEW